MAISSKTSWEVRTTGNNSNGGGFDTSATGTDYSQQNSAQYSASDLVIDGTTNTLVSSASHSFVAADVGNVMNITAGTGFTFGRYQIVSVSGGKATLDRSVGTLSSTGGSYAVGGALAWPGIACGVAVAGNTIWVKSGTYTLSSSSSNVAGGIVSIPGDGGNPDGTSCVMEGYGSTRGDLGTRPIISNPSSGGFSSITIIQGGESWCCRNIEVDAGGALNTSVTCFGGGASYGQLFRCLARNFTTAGFAVGATFIVSLCGATGGVGSGSVGFNMNNGGVAYCEAWSNAGTGFYVGYAAWCEAWENAGAGFKQNNGGAAVYSNCLSYRNGGKGFELQNSGTGSLVVNCTSAYNTSDGFYIQWATYYAVYVVNCISYGNGGWGYQFNGAHPGSVHASNIVGGLNTSGNWPTNASQQNGGEKLQGASTFYDFRSARPADLVALSASPFTSAVGTTGGARDFTLNSTAGGGAVCRGAGVFSSTPSGNTHTIDLGAIPAPSGGAAGGLLVHPGMGGGMRG